MGCYRRFWIALISVDWGALLIFGSSACANECRAWAYLWSYGWCTTFGDNRLFAAATFLLQSARNSTWWLDLKFSNVLSHFSYFENEASASILAAILTSRLPFDRKMETWCVWSTDWLIISLSITRINGLLTGMSLSIVTAKKNIVQQTSDKKSYMQPWKNTKICASSIQMKQHTTVSRRYQSKLKHTATLFFVVRPLHSKTGMESFRSFPVLAVWKKQKCFFPINSWNEVLWGASVSES